MELSRQQQHLGRYTLTYKPDDIWGADSMLVHADKEFVFRAQNRYTIEGNFKFSWNSDPTLTREQCIEVLLRDTAALQRDLEMYIIRRHRKPPSGYMLWFDESTQEGELAEWSLESAIADPSLITRHKAFPQFHELGVHTSFATARYTTPRGLLLGPTGLDMDVSEGKTSWMPGEDLVVVDTICEQEIASWVSYFASHTSKYKDFFEKLNINAEPSFKLLQRST